MARQLALNFNRLILILTVGLGSIWAEELAVDSSIISVDPTRIGEGGGTLTIHGQNFAEKNFNEFEPTLGNKVSRFIT